MNANWDLAKDLVDAGADVDQWDIFGMAPLFTAVGSRSRTDGGRAGKCKLYTLPLHWGV